MSINEFNTGEVDHNPWDCENPLCPPCTKMIDDYTAAITEAQIDEDRL